MKSKLVILLIVLTFAAIRVNAQPGCPSIDAGPHQTVNCTTPCTTLNATVVAPGSTTGYTCTSIPYAPPAAFNAGTPTLVATDDQWSPLYTIPFTFCFFNNQYNQYVVGSNGIMSFNTAYAGAWCQWECYAGTTIPTTTYQINSIMTPYGDLDPTYAGGIYYHVIGTAPCRMLIVSWYQVAYYGGANSVNTGYCATPPIYETAMAVCYESTNIIEIYIKQKNICTAWNGGLAIEGIQNAAGTAAVAAPGRNCTQFACTNDAYRFTPNGPTNYTVTWSPATGLSATTGTTVTACPPATTLYTAHLDITLCTGTHLLLSDTVTVSVSNTIGLTITPANPVICGGGSSTLTANSTNPLATFQWSSGPTTASIIVNPTATTTYTVTATVPGCTTTASTTVTVSPIPTVTATATPNPICAGQPTTLTAGGATTYLWSTGSTVNPLTVTPTGTTTYTVTGTTAAGCSNTASVTVTVNPIPIVTISPSVNPVCLGSPTTLTGSGAATYHWSTGSNVNPLVVTPTGTTTYTVTGTSAGCTNTASIVINVSPTLVVTITPSASSICVGASTTLTLAGGTTYLWNTGSTANPYVVTPLVTTTYTVTGTTAGCTGTASVTITVNPLPTVTIAASVNPICTSGSTVLTAFGANTYVWSGGLGTTTSITVAPTATTTYTVTGTSAFGCTGSATITVVVSSNPIVNIVASANPICLGASAVLTANGASSYTWSTGSTLNPITVAPISTTTYSVTGSIAGCTGSTDITITVNPNPTVSISALANPICLGSSTTLTALGANTYLWSGGLGTISPIIIFPTSTTTYSVTGTDVNGCTGTASILVNVNPLPTVNITASLNPICAGTSTVLTATGGSTYLWSGGLGAANPVIASPTSTTTYTVTGTDVNGCTGTSSITVLVNPNPPITITASVNPICLGNQTIITAIGASTYLWSGGLGTANPVIITPTSTTTYSVTGTDINGCTGTANITITVNANPTVSISASANPICNGSSTTLVANGATTYLWNGGSTNNPLTVSPTSTTTYTVTGTSTGCTGTASITVTVNPNPIVTIGAFVNPICEGFSTTLTAGGAAAYTWSSGSTANPLVITPTSTTLYTVTGTSLGCTGTDTLTVIVNPNPIVTASSTNENCGLSNGTATATTTGACISGYTYAWNGVSSQTTQTAINLPAGTYTVTVYCDGCSGTASTTITNLPGPSVGITNIINTICGYADGSAMTSVTGNNPPFNYNWSNGQTGAGLVNILAGSYIVTITDAVGCTATNDVTITDSPGPLASVTSQNDICLKLNGTATATATGGTGSYTYLWNDGQTSSTATGLAHSVYTVTVTDANGCTVSESINVAETPGPNAGFNAEPSILTPFENPVNFLDNSSGNVISWQWNFGDGSMGSGNNTNHSYPNLGIYLVTLIVTDNNGCQDTTTDTIKVKDNYSFYIPNAFTPNNDGYNDVFSPKGVFVDPDSYDEYIFDRWGNIIFHTSKWDVINHQAETWDGTKNNSGDYNSAIMGTYVYRITLKEIDGVKHEYIGRISIVP